MPQQTINIGSAPDDGTGDTLRVGGDKINDNFTELYAFDVAVPELVRDTMGTALVAGTNITITPNDGADTITIAASSGGAIEVLDEGVTETASLVSIDFVGAGVTANDDGSGNVTVTIAGGGGYNAENARDDIGAALVEGAGIDITVNDGADTITIAALTYEAGPPTPPVSGSYSWDNQGTSTVTDGTKALILKPQVDGILHGMVAAAPATPWNLYCRVKMDCLSTAVNTTQISQAAGVVLKDTGGDNERLLLGIYVERIAGDENINYGAIIQRWTGASPPVFSATPVLKLGNRPWDWIRVANDGTTITLYVSYNGVDWITAGTETLAAFIDGAASAGFGATASANATEAAAFFSYFSFTAPA